MKTIHEIKAEREKKQSALIEACGMFFAFSKEQFEQGKTPLKEGEKYADLGGGGFMPNGNVEQYVTGAKELDKWYKDEIKANNARRAHIVYELANHEAFYTGEIDDTVRALGSDYTEAEVLEVYRTESKNQSVGF